MAKNTRVVSTIACSGCLKTITYKEGVVVELTMHPNKPESGNYGTYVCTKCEPKFRLDRRVHIK